MAEKKKKNSRQFSPREIAEKKLKELQQQSQILSQQCGQLMPLVVPSSIHNLAVIAPEMSHELVHDTFVLVNQSLVTSPLRYIRKRTIANALLKSYFQLQELDANCKQIDDLVAAEKVAWEERNAKAEADAKAEGKKLKDKEPMPDHKEDYPIIDLSNYVNLVFQFYDLRDFDKMDSNVKYRKKLFARISQLAVRTAAVSKIALLDNYNKQKRYEIMIKNYTGSVHK